MPIGEFENSLTGPLAKEIEAYGSSWFDMRTAAQVIYCCRELKPGLGNLYSRKGLVDGAVITYGRCFVKGPRTHIADIRGLLDALTADELEIHQTVMRWRDKHVGHRVDQTLEDVKTFILWGDWHRHAPTIRVRLETQTIPDLPSFEQRFEDLASKLAVSIWEEHLYPLQQKLFAELGHEELLRLKIGSRTWHERTLPEQWVRSNLNIGSIPPPKKWKGRK